MFLNRLFDHISSRIFTYGNFYLVFCKDLKYRYIRPLDPKLDLKVVQCSNNELYIIKRDLDMNMDIIYLQTGDNLTDSQIIKINKNKNCIACIFVRKVNKIKSPSGYRLNFGDNVFFSWIFGLYIHPDYRLRGYLPNLVSHAFQLSNQNRSHGLLGEIHYMNEASLRAFMRLGFKVCKNIHYLKLLNIKYYWEGKKKY